MKKAGLLVLKVVLPAALFIYLLSSVDAEDYSVFWSQPKRWELLLAAQAVALTAIIVSFVRWLILVRSFGIPFSLREALRLGFLGYLLNFVSLGSVGGDLFKAILVARDKPERRPEAIASVLLDRAIGLLGLVILAWISLTLAPSGVLSIALVSIRRAAGIVAIVSIVALLFAVFAGVWFERLIDWGARIPLVGEPAARMARAVRMLRNSPWVIAQLLAMAVFVHTLLSFTVYLVSSGIYVEHPTLQQHLMVVPPGMAAGALPLAPGGLGLQEGALNSLFNELSLPSGYSGIIVATVYRLITIVIVGIGLLIYWMSHGREFKFVKRVQGDSIGG